MAWRTRLEPSPNPAGPPRVAGEGPLPGGPGFAGHPRWPAKMAAARARSGGHAAGVAGSCSPGRRADAFRRGLTVAIVRRALGECGAKSAPVGAVRNRPTAALRGVQPQGLPRQAQQPEAGLAWRLPAAGPEGAVW